MAKVSEDPLSPASMSTSLVVISSRVSRSLADALLAAVALSKPLPLARKVLVAVLAAVVCANLPLLLFLVLKVPLPTYAWIDSLR